MTLFNKDFYPTPKDLAEYILEGIDWRMVETVLEPSAGAGDLADVIKEKTTNAQKRGYWSSDYKPDIDCIEIEPELRSILTGKGYRVVHDNFLNYFTHKKYSIIIANPPFDQGEKHLNKMLEIQKDGGSIICILNAQTLKNPHTYERKELIKKLNNLNASIEYTKGAFKTAERKTNTEIAIVKLHIPNKDKESLIISELRKAEKLKEINQENKSIIEDDYIKQAVALYNFEVQAGLNLIEEYTKIKPYMSNSFEENRSHEILKLTFNEHNGYEPLPNEYIKRVRYKYWSNLFTNQNFTKNFTTNLLEKCREKTEELKDYDFNEWNILNIRAEMTKDIIKGVEDTIVELFDKLTYEHHFHPETSKNRWMYNGWKTNSAYKIGKKSILPIRVFEHSALRGDGWCTGYRQVEELENIEKALNYLNGKPNDHISIRDAISKAANEGQLRKISTKYFTLDVYYKGTVHLTYKDPELIQILNRKGAQGKSWLPPGYGKKEYNEMSQQEKEVINSFEGEEEYNKVRSNPEIYLPEIKGMLQLGE